MPIKPIKPITALGTFIVGIGLSFLSVSALSAEQRCGWIENPSPGTWWLMDKDATWEISTRGGYSVPATSIDNLPDVIPNQYIRISGIYGYSCGCLSVDTDKQNRRIKVIHQKGKQVFLKQCLEEPAIANQRKQISPTVVLRPSVKAGEKQVSVSDANTGTPHFVQVITTSNRDKANSLKESFAKDGFNTVVTSVMSNGRNLYRVNFGPFASKPLALQAQATLKGIFAANANVQGSIVLSAKPNG